jgi:vitamin B12/bleomycin/antimicrobial peptide transport system ATP-binding/permease protein
MMFLPQRPNLPLGTLRAVLCDPAAPNSFDDGLVRATLERCGLSDFLGVLDENRRWNQSLSRGQQQRVAFARMILHRPRWVLMDEATSAPDDENQESMLSLFDAELKGASILSIGHRPGLEEFHNRTLHIRKSDEGAILLAPPSRIIAPLRSGYADFTRRCDRPSQGLACRRSQPAKSRRVSVGASSGSILMMRVNIRDAYPRMFVRSRTETIHKHATPRLHER